MRNLNFLGVLKNREMFSLQENPVVIPSNHALPKAEPIDETKFRLLNKEGEKERLIRIKEEEKERKRFEKEKKPKRIEAKIGHEAVPAAVKTEVTRTPEGMSSLEDHKVSLFVHLSLPRRNTLARRCCLLCSVILALKVCQT